MNRNHFLSTALLVSALSCTILGWVSAAPNTQRPPISSGPVLNGNRNLPPARNILNGNPIPLMMDMIGYARTGTIASGTKAAVYATVVIASAGSGYKAGSSKTSYANGVLNLVGAKGDEHFEGSFKLAQNSGDASTPFRVSSSTILKVRIYQSGRVNLTTSIPIKKSSSTMSFTSNGADGFLWGRATGGSPQLVSISFSKGTASTSRTVPMPPKPQPAPPPPQPSGPRGMKVRVGGEIRVTNSDDGVADGQVEMFGDVAFNGQERWRIKRSSARDQDKGDVILLDYMTIDVYFNDASTSMLAVTGSLRDRDINKGDTVIRGDDSMWNTTRNNVIRVDLKQLVEFGNGRLTLYGDGDSENANVVIIARKISDIN